jgi:hypothetical protein
MDDSGLDASIAAPGARGTALERKLVSTKDLLVGETVLFRADPIVEF